MIGTRDARARGAATVRSGGDRPDLAGAARRRSLRNHAFLAALAYVPLLLTKPGQVGADTKQYLYLDPGRMLGCAASLWDPNVGLGTVTHQNIGYLFPMGPFYWVLQQVGSPDWVAQRLWLATIMFAAGAGMLFLFRVLDIRGPGAMVGALVFMLSPYLLTVAARLSVLLLPWAGLPWMLGLAILALRRGGWRYPALFAVVVAIVGGVNATALIYAGLGPVLYFPFAVWVEHQASARQALATMARIGVLTLVTSLWWIAGLSIQAGYGLDVLAYSETMRAVALTSLSSETLRGLGYWFFYGGDKLGPWTESSVPYTQNIALLLASFALPTFAFISAVTVRWRHRAYFVALIFVGTVIAVGAYPYDGPSIWGSVVKKASNESTAAFAMRSSGRVVPIVALGCAVLLAAGVSALARTRPRRAAWVAIALAGLAAANLPALFTGGLVAENLKRPEHIPAYWQKAADWLDARGHDTRVLELPGSDFTSYRWGNTVEPITPGLMDRPYVARELIPYGSPPSADLLNALDRRLQEGVLEPEAIAPVARLMSVGDVVLRSDLQFERFNTPRPRPTWRFFTPPPAGLADPVGFGRPVRNTPKQYPMIDELALSEPPGEPDPPPVSAFAVRGAPPIVRTAAADRPVLLAGDGEGVVDAAAIGLLDRPSALLYSGSFAGDPAGMKRVLAAGADLVLTDSNRRRARRWSTVREVTGYTEQAEEKKLADDLVDARLDVFPRAGDDAFTVAQQRGVRRVQATHYANPVSYTPEDRAVRALDGDRFTAWRVGAFDDPRGERLEIELAHPVTTSRVRLLQPVNGDRNRWITRATLTFDGGASKQIRLGSASRRGQGEWVDIGRRTFKTMSLRIDRLNFGPRETYGGLSAVGMAEVGFDGVKARADEVIRLPRDLLAAASAGSIDHRLDILLDRQRSNGFPPRADEENYIARAFSLPVSRSFGVTGTARLSLGRDDQEVDAVVGKGGGIVARSSARLPGDLQARASSAFDGDPATAWTPPFAGPTTKWIEAKLPAPVTFDHLDLVLVADKRHSLPTKLRVETEQGVRRVSVPKITSRSREGATVALPLRLRRPLTGQTVRVVLEQVKARKTRNYFTGADEPLPVAIAEAGIPGVRMSPTPTAFDSGCRADLLTVDARKVEVRVTGNAPAAEARGPLAVDLCGADAGGLTLAPGEHVLRTTSGGRTGIDLDRLVLSSAAGGASLPPPAPGRVAPPSPPSRPSPAITIERDGRTAKRVRVAAPTQPFWLVLGQSHNLGWEAKTNGRSLGPPTVIDGFANGWLIRPDPQGRDVSVDLEWTPQRRVWVMLPISALGLLLCLALALANPGRKRALGGAPEPRLVPPWRHRGSRPRRATTAVVTAGVAVVVTLVAGLPTGVLAGGLTLAAVLVPRARALVTLGAVGGLAAAGLYTAALQYIANYPSVFEWPTFFRVSHNLAWVGAALLAADVVAGLARDRASPPADAQP